MLWGYAGVWPGDFGVDLNQGPMPMLQFIVAHGFRSTGVSASRTRDPHVREEVGRYVDEHDLRIAVHPDVRIFGEGADQAARRTDAFLDELPGLKELLRVPIVTTGAGPVHRFLRSPCLEEQMDRLTEVLTPLARGCHEQGCPLGIENHGDYYCSDLVDLCKRVPHLGIFLDTGNTFLVGEKPIPAAREAAPYTIGTHFKDIRPEVRPGELTFVSKGAPLGDGDVGLAEIYDILRQHAPDPDALVMHWEMVPGETDPFEALERSWAFVKSLPGVTDDLEAAHAK